MGYGPQNRHTRPTHCPPPWGLQTPEGLGPPRPSTRTRTRTHRHVVPLAYVVDVHGDGGVRADAVLLHQPDQLRLSQVVGRGGAALGVREGEGGTGRKAKQPVARGEVTYRGGVGGGADVYEVRYASVAVP